MERVYEFMEASQLGRLDHLLRLLKSSDPLDVNCTDDDENTALQIAAAGGQRAAVELLLDGGAQVDKPNRCGWTPLMQAARQGNTALVDVLVGRGASVNATDKLGTTALSCAVRSGVLSCVKALLDRGTRPSLGTAELTPLMVAAQLGYTSIVKQLVDAGFDLNQRSKSAGLDALMFAASNGHKGTAQLLVECGANAKATNVCGKTALDVAIARGKKQVRCYLDENARNGDSDLYERAEANIFEAVANGDLPSVRRLLEERPSLVNCSRKADGFTPLALAASLGDLRTIECLLTGGAAVDHRGASGGWTPLVRAIFHGHEEAALLLLRNGADTSLKDRHGFCAFEIAALVASTDVDFLRSLTPLYAVSQTLLTSGSPTSDSETKQNWWNQLSGYFQQLAAKMPKVQRPSVREEVGLASPGPRRDCGRPRPETSREPVSGLSSSVENLLLRLNTASPCRLALPSRSPKPIVFPSWSPYGSDTGSSSGRCKMPAAIALPECFSSMLRHELSSTEDGCGEEDVDLNTAIPSQTIAGSPTDFETEAELYAILERLSLEKYYPLFDEEEVDTVAFALLTEQDLMDLGIDDAPSRKKLTAVISRLKNNSAQKL